MFMEEWRSHVVRERRGGEGGIRTLDTVLPVYHISSVVLSAAQPPLHAGKSIREPPVRRQIKTGFPARLCLLSKRESDRFLYSEFRHHIHLAFVHGVRPVEKIHHVLLHDDAAHALEARLVIEHPLFVPILVKAVRRTLVFPEQAQEPAARSEGDVIALDVFRLDLPCALGGPGVVAAADIADETALSRGHRKLQVPPVAVDEKALILLRVDDDAVADLHSPLRLGNGEGEGGRRGWAHSERDAQREGDERDQSEVL